MSRYPPSDYRGTRDRSRSPPRFPDRRASTASIFDGRPPGPPRTASDAPRGPRSQFDAPRPPPQSGNLGAPGTSRPTYGSLRDAPPLQSGDRGRPYRDREYDRRDNRPPSPRDRSPPRNFKESREYPPRDLDIGRARRESRDGPPSAGSNYSDNPPFASAAPVRGGFTRGRGRGEFSFRGGRGGRTNVDDRDLFRRDRSPQPRWGRDEREPARRDDRLFDRREDDRRASDWGEREREREVDRSRRDQPPSRLETRPSPESFNLTNAPQQSSQTSLINPARLAMIESSGVETSVRRPSIHLEPPSNRDGRREPSETPSYLTSRVESTQNRYAPRGSSPPTQAPPVPAFGSFAPAALASAPPSQSALSSQPPKPTHESKSMTDSLNGTIDEQPKTSEERKLDVPVDAPTGPRAPPPGPKAQLASPPPAAPRAPRAYETEDITPSNRLHGVRSLESFPGQGASLSSKPISHSLSPAVTPALPNLIQPVSPSPASRFAELSAPTGPRASRVSPAHASVSPRPPAASPRSDVGSFQSIQRTQTPPPSAPSGPRNKSYSVSPKVASTIVPTAPKADRQPPSAPRGPERSQGPSGRAPDRLAAPNAWAPPSAPKGPSWNQWRRQGLPPYGDKTIPVKRDFLGEEKGRISNQEQSATLRANEFSTSIKAEDRDGRAPEIADRRPEEKMDLDRPVPRRQSSLVDHGHSAAISFFGKPAEEDDEDTAMSDAGQDVPSTSEDDDSDIENDFNLTLFNAKFERQKRKLEAEFADLSSRHYRSTTPLESIARLSRISVSDLRRVNEKRQRGMEVDGSPTVHHQRLLAPTTHSSDSGEGPDLLTPNGPDDHRVAIRRSDSSSEGIRRVRKASLEPINLPYLLKDAPSAFQDTARWQEDSGIELIDALTLEMRDEEDDDADVELMFSDIYRKWRHDCESLDRIREEQERLDRQQSLEPGPEADPPGILPTNPLFEGRRLHKHSSEYEIEQVLKQSEETARIEQERQDREAKKNQADMEKEATIPDLLTEDEMRRETFIDTNTYRDAESLSLVFSYEPRPDNFTEEEQNIFVAAFKETPKKWSEIASLLDGRTYEECIRHYYANKWDGRFRDNRTKKLKAGGRRGRGGGRGPRGRVGGIMADLVRAEELLGPEHMTEKGRPRRAAAPVTFAEKEEAAKASLLGQSPAKKLGPGSKADSNGDVGLEKPGNKRQKKTGEKPGRKPKANPPLAHLAAAPQTSPGKQLLHSKEDMSRGQRLEEASLLTGFQAGHHGMVNADGQMAYVQDGYMQQVPQPDGSERTKAAAGPAKQGASSYWSVPEQNDFVKYIHHFGRDFGAIAAHMGTKTQTMIKNHYQRQVDSGNRQELEKFADEADARKDRGEDLGPPPEPTPIVKRKYENPVSGQRALAPQSEAMEIDDNGPAVRPQPPKHTSPPQYQTQQRLTSSIQNPSAPAPRVEPSPLISTTAPATPLSSTSSLQKSIQNPLGSRITFLPDTRNDSRPPTQTVPGFRAAQEPVSQSQVAQNGRNPPDMAGPQFIRSLMEEQNKALRMQEQQYVQQDRGDLYQRHNPMNRNSLQGSPIEQALHHPPDRKPNLEERPVSPPRSTFPSSRPLFGSSAQFGLGSAAFPTITGRHPFNPSPTKREESRSGSVSAMGGFPPAASAPPPEPKQSSIMSLLNAEPDEPKPPKRESYATPNAGSPTAQVFSSSISGSNIPALRREPSFGQPSVPQSLFQRGGGFGQQSSTPVPAPHKHESPASGPLSHSTKPPNWAAHVLGQTNQQSPPTPTLERDVRPYNTSHRSVLGSLGQQRANPSPPPLLGISHSRTPSISAQSAQQPREQHRPSLSGQHSAQPLHPNPYASHQPSQLPQPQSQPGQSQSHAHHSHNSSLNSPFPPIHHRVMSRDIDLRRDAANAAQRDREEQESIWSREALEEKRRREEHYQMQRQQEHERDRERQQSLHRAPPPLQAPTFGSQFGGQNKGLDLREQSRMEVEMAMQQERQREHDRQREHGLQQRMMRDREQADEYRRLQEVSMRRTPLGGGYGVPPPPAPRR